MPAATPPPLPVYLTTKERKRIRRQAREERRNEERDKIALGLMDAPEPKLKLANFMKVLGDQAVADPSKIERKVMEQVQARATNHEMRNLARKLTPQERKDKQRAKLAEDTSSGQGVTVAVFRVKDLSHPRHQFKVDMNALQNGLTGGVLTCKGGEEDPLNPGQLLLTSSLSGLTPFDSNDEGLLGNRSCVSVVVVEGGPKAVARYTKLMCRRMQWAGGTDEGGGSSSSEDVDEDDQAGAGGGGPGGFSKGKKGANFCELVWKGVVVKRSFSAFKFQTCNTARAARKVMDSKGVAHYWDMATGGIVAKV